MSLIITCEAFTSKPNGNRKIRVTDPLGRTTTHQPYGGMFHVEQYAEAMQSHIAKHYSNKEWFAEAGGETFKGYTFAMKEMGT